MDSTPAAARKGSSRRVSFGSLPLVVAIPPSLSCGSVFLHVAQMAKHLKILKPLIVLVPIPMVYAKARFRTVVLATLAAPYPLNKALRLFRRQTVIPRFRVPQKHFLTLRLPTIRRPPRSNLLPNLRTLLSSKPRLRFAGKSQRHGSILLRSPHITRLALTAPLRCCRHWLSTRRARNLFSRHVVAPIAKA